MSEKQSIYAISTVSLFSHTYYIKAETEQQAREAYDRLNEHESFKEGSQCHLGENFVDIRSLNEQEFIEDFDRRNGYLSTWLKELKLARINDPAEWSEE